MADLRQAARRLLDAVEDGGHKSDVMAAVDALRAALAESERDWSMLEATQESLREHMAEIHRLRAELAQAEPPCDHCRSPLFAALQCRVCGRKEAK